MKTGDYKLCKKSITKSYITYFQKNRYYKIVSTNTERIQLRSETGYAVSFFINQPNSDEFKLNNHFCTIQEERKIKLLKIKKS